MSQGPERPAEGAPVVPEAADDGAASGVDPSAGHPAEARQPDRSSRKSTLREWLETVVVALLVALVIRGFVVQVYLVEGESMEPTLHTQERLLVNKFLYWFRGPAPGEIVVLRDPTQGRELIKRVVAVAGETVEVRSGVVYVDGKPLDEPYKNTLYTQYPDTPAVEVPEGSIYVMGDNRGRSYDSRMIGPVEIDLVDGKAFFLFWPLDRFAAGPLDHSRTYAGAGASK